MKPLPEPALRQIKLPSNYFVFTDPIVDADGYCRPLLWRRGDSLMVIGAITDPDAARTLAEILGAVEIEGV